MDPCWKGLQQYPIMPPTRSTPSHITAIDSEADQENLVYIQTHPQSNAEVTRLCQVQQLLHTRLFRLFCPSTDLLIDYALGLLDRDQHITIGEHLSLCPHCSAEVVLLSRTTPLSEREDY